MPWCNQQEEHTSRARIQSWKTKFWLIKSYQQQKNFTTTFPFFFFQKNRQYFRPHMGPKCLKGLDMPGVAVKAGGLSTHRSRRMKRRVWGTSWGRGWDPPQEVRSCAGRQRFYWPGLQPSCLQLLAGKKKSNPIQAENEAFSTLFLDKNKPFTFTASQGCGIVA